MNLRVLGYLFFVLTFCLFTLPLHAQDSLVSIYRTEDSWVLVIPEGQIISLDGLAFLVETGTGDNIYFLKDYPAFADFPFYKVKGSVCFRLVLEGSDDILPLECQEDALLLEQEVNDAERFWYNPTTGSRTFVVRVQIRDQIPGLCAFQDVCELDPKFWGVVEVTAINPDGANVHTGPGTVFPLADVLLEEGDACGRDETGTWLVLCVEGETIPQQWVNTDTVDVEGDIETLRIFKAPEPPQVIADDNSCEQADDGDEYNEPNLVTVEYSLEIGRGCVAKIHYQISEWGAYHWLLSDPDLSAFRGVMFSIRADVEVEQIKIELKRDAENLSAAYIQNVGIDWQSFNIPFRRFQAASYGTPLESFEEVNELVLTLELPSAGVDDVTVYLDNILFWQDTGF